MAKAKVKYPLGTPVQVREGAVNPEFPDIPLTGWTGVVEDVAPKKTPPSYLVEWDERTLATLPEAYRQRCEEQRLYHRLMWLAEDDLEATSK